MSQFLAELDLGILLVRSLIFSLFLDFLIFISICLPICCTLPVSLLTCVIIRNTFMVSSCSQAFHASFLPGEQESWASFTFTALWDLFSNFSFQLCQSNHQPQLPLTTPPLNLP